VEAARRDEEESLRNNPADTTLEIIVSVPWVGGLKWSKLS
tara:strand:- start:71 stop:190 length:120 start_codon:yes stop_codon:yes gene_type:complete